MLGFYNYTVILTYASLVSAVCGMACAKLDHPMGAVFCLLLCGLCDMFDGKVARAKKNRTTDEKKFGIQIDSLCDLVCFGVLPAVICLEVWGDQPHTPLTWILVTAVCCFYVLAGLIRLAFFNVTEESRQDAGEGVRTKYQGLPITSAALIVPIVYILRFFLLEYRFQLVFTVVLLIVGVLFITPFRIKKPKMKQMLLMLAVGILIAVILILVSVHRTRLPRMQTEAETQPHLSWSAQWRPAEDA